MHDCRKFKERLVDLLFESAGADERSRLLREVNSCEACQNLYRSMSEALAVFDQVADTALPEEAYWTGYNERLRARLSEQPRPRRRALAALVEMISLARLPLPVRIAVASLLVAAALWLVFSQKETTRPREPEVVANDQPASGQETLSRDDKRVETAGPKTIQTTAPVPRRKTNRETRGHKPVEAVDVMREDRAYDRRAATADYLSLEVAGHVEQAELLMRSFRNIEQSPEQAAVDVSYEKELSKELLAKNRRLRRSAENRRNLAVGDLLTDIEPLLLDIANLPDSPTQDDVRSIKDLMQRQEVVAALQFYTAKASSRNY
ncbi:MAG TPA: hypothetical protein VKA70_07905 [Blastocatellia bacterium]|nr:hypothetical protein [Blastocatellia bacterium]